ncbi:hydroxyacid dehydrogenase [Oceanobacillus timonensis]|uniref:hydroxyacid dehydrogenase n=1 Tax=Oceanobacillus timonensis TaxID=1926285 RepID=UPI0009B9D126|nr:hydroxyacid dehydrogenase [Oceanobacillus timonensis]
MKILVTELIWNQGIEKLEQEGYAIDYDKELGRNREKLLSIISNYDGLIVRNETKVDSELLDKGTNLKVIGRLGVGLDNIDLKTARDKNMTVVAAKHANATSVAEYVLSAMLDAYRDISQATMDVRKGNWARKKFTGVELSGKTLGLYGMGEIAHRVAKRAKVFGMNVVGYDPFITPYDHIVSETGVKQVNTFEEFITTSDFISIHVPLTKDTKNIFNKEAFLKMKGDAYIINTARGGIINEHDLCIAVESGEITGAYLDVLETEPVQPDSQLLHLESIHLTPHIAGLTEESQLRTSVLVAEEVSNILKGKRSLCSV